MLALKIESAVPLDDLKRRFEYMSFEEKISIESIISSTNSFQDVLNFPFVKLPLYHRLKETIKRSTIFNLDNIDDYFKYVVYNHTNPFLFNEQDYELVVYVNSQLVGAIQKKYKNQIELYMSKLQSDLDSAVWFDKTIPFWVNTQYF